VSTEASEAVVGAPPARRALDRTAQSLRWTLPLLGPLAIGVAIIGTWQAGVWNDLFGLGSFTLPRPTDIVHAFGDYRSELLTNLGETVKPAVFGYLLGNGAGVALGALLVIVPGPLARRFSGLFVAMQALPIIALVPVAALWFGSGLLFQTVVAAILTFPSMLVYANRGMTHIGADVEHLLASYEATRWQFFLKVRLPNSLPFAFAALRYTVVLSVIGVVVAEILLSRGGLGYEIDDALQSFSTGEAWAAAAILSALGIVWYAAMGLLERIAVPWGADQRGR
jgi:NitT/TauT family transport system permease protein